jgi:hypothetical protein
MKKLIALISIATLVGVTLLTSCNKNETPKHIIENQDLFLSVLRQNMGNVGDVPVGDGARKSGFSGEIQTIYLDILEITPEILEKAENVRTLQDISEIIVSTGATLQQTNENGNLKVQFDIPVQEAQRSLNPIISEAEKYLKSKGFLEQELKNMIAENGATEYDLIPLVIILQEKENPGMFANCATVAIGKDVKVLNLSKTTINETFSILTSKISGVVGSAIVVGNYMQCVYKETDIIVENMITSDEFAELLEVQILFNERLAIENYLETQIALDLQNVKNRDEFMVWIKNNLSHTEFSSIGEASDMFETLESQIGVVAKKHLSEDLQQIDAALLEKRISLLIKNLEVEIPPTKCRCTADWNLCLDKARDNYHHGIGTSVGAGGLIRWKIGVVNYAVAAVIYYTSVIKCNNAFTGCPCGIHGK